jgi:hypothetical protein
MPDIDISGFRTCKWYDATNRKILFGVQAKVKNAWCNYLDGDELFYNTERDAMKKIKELCKKEGVL